MDPYTDVWEILVNRVVRCARQVLTCMRPRLRALSGLIFRPRRASARILLPTARWVNDTSYTIRAVLNTAPGDLYVAYNG